MITMKRIFTLLVISACIYFFKSTTYKVYAKTRGGVKMGIILTSTAFSEGSMIPRDYTCDGRDISPPLAWTGVPKDAKSLAIICDDPDAPMGTWVHWVLFNIPATVNELTQNIPSDKVLKNGAKQGINDFRSIGYGGPCPPGGTHRYYFKIYALNTGLIEEPGLTKAELIKAMKGHILAEGQLMGRYKR
jgi:Raf kinase inhibitor-like YbhB/YbcL family protein